jgi:hypothetical protein
MPASNIGKARALRGDGDDQEGAGSKHWRSQLRAQAAFIAELFDVLS